MQSTTHWRRAAMIGIAALVVGCAPDTPERGNAATDSGAGGADSRDSSAASREPATRPPTTTPSPAAPGGAAAPPAASPPPRLVARADIKPLGDNTVRGIVEFQSTGSEGPLMIDVMLMGLDAGPHGFHVHEGTDCMAPGEHLNPQNAPHGPANAAAGARHLGDLGNVTADAAGMVDEMLRDSLLGGEISMLIGKVLVVHAGQDDLSTQPSGSSGDPIGCGVIEAGEDVLSRSDTQDRGV